MNNETLIPIGGYKKISPADILMLKAQINYTQIYLHDGSQILSSITLGIFENRLKGFSFLRPNRSTIINLQYIIEDKSFSTAYPCIKMINNIDIPISRRRTTLFYKMLKLNKNFNQ